MNESEKKKAFNSALKQSLKAKTAIQINTHAEIVRLLKVAQAEIAITLAGMPTDYQRWILSDLQFEINRMLQAFGDASATVVGSAAGEAWQAGQNVTDAPIAAIGASAFNAALPRLNINSLNSMRAFMTDRIKDIGVQAANEINSQLGLVVIGAQSPGDAITKVGQILGTPASSRAKGIVVTELGRVFSKAGQERMEQAVKYGAPLKKKWLRSGKLKPRLNHNAAHGQTVPVDEPFLIPAKNGGSAIRMMYPQDPAAPIGEVIRCGCTSVPAVDGSLSDFVSKVEKNNGAAYSKEELRQRAAEFRARK